RRAARRRAGAGANGRRGCRRWSCSLYRRPRPAGRADGAAEGELMAAGSGVATSGEMRAAARAGVLLPALLCIFGISGVSGLIYQVVWLRMLTLTFGVTSFAVATVLCGFMGGLALGSFLAGRVADRIARPLVAYAGAELLIGATGMASPLLFV